MGVAGGGGGGPVSRVKVEAEICCCLPLPHLPQTLQKPSPELKQQLTGHSKRVAGSVTELIQAAEAMKGEGCPGAGREGKPLFWGELCFQEAAQRWPPQSPHRCQGLGTVSMLPAAPDLPALP